MDNVISEMAPLSDKDCFFLIDRTRTEFDIPIYKYDTYVLNFVSNCRGARRIVGDSIETLGDYDLVLIGPDIEYSWDQGSCDRDTDKREITILIPVNLLGRELLNKSQLKPIKYMLENASRGVAFGMETIMKVYSAIDWLAKAPKDFYRLLRLLEVLHMLSVSPDQHQLVQESFTAVRPHCDSDRVSRVEEEIVRNYTKPLRLNDMAAIAGMTPTAFSRFFKRHTGRNLSDYIIDLRIAHAARKLVDTNMPIAEICFDSGFNNISNFNRAFKRKKGCPPKAFRDNYHKNKVIV